MSDFRLKVQAQLDAKQLTSELNALKNQYKKIPISVDLKGANKLDNLKTNIEFLQGAKGIHINVDTASLKEASTDLKNLATVVKGLQKTDIKINTSTLDNQMKSAGTNAGKSYATAMQKQIEAMSRSQQTSFTQPLRNITKAQQDYSDWWNKELKKSSNKNYGKNQQFIAFDEYKAEMDDLEKRAKRIQNYVSKDSLGVDTTSIRKSLNKYSNVDSDMLNKAWSSYQKLISLKKELETGISDDGFGKTLSDKDFVSKFEQYNSLLEKTRNQVKILGNEFSGLSKPLTVMDRNVASNRTLAWLNNNSRAAKEYGNILRDLAEKQRNAASIEELKQYNKEVKSITSQAQMQGLTGKSLAEDSKRAFGQIFQFAGMYGMIQNIAFEVPKQIISSVKEIDTAMTNLYKVTDETEARYSKFQQTASTTSKELGRSISSYITQVSEWSKLGYTMDQSEELAKNSAIYANVGEVSDATAVSDMVTAMKAFNIEASDSITIVDSLNKLGNEFAVSSSDLGEGLSNSASSLAAAGNDMNQSLAMLTGMTEITQSASESGNALKILAMRVRGYDEETESYSNDTEELSGKIADLTKTAKTPGGISLFTDETKQTYKDTYTLLKEISEIYDNLTDKNQAALLETLAGKNRGNQIAALLQSFKSGQVEKAYEASLNSAGSAQQEQNRWMQSIEAKIEKFKATFQELSTNVLSSDIFGFAVDSGTVFVDVLNKIISVGNGIPVLFASIAGIKIFKNLD